MLACPAEDVEHYIMQRGELANGIDGLNEEIGRLCDEAPDGTPLRDAADGLIEFGRVPSEYHCIYYSGQSVRSVMERIKNAETQVRGRLEKLREEARQHLKDNQALPQIKKYLATVGEGPVGGALKDEKV